MPRTRDNVINDPDDLTDGAGIETPAGMPEPQTRPVRVSDPDASQTEPLVVVDEPTEPEPTPVEPEPKTTNPRRTVRAAGMPGEPLVDQQSPIIATPAENAALVHSDPSGGATTRQDGLDAGVPMLPGSPDEPQGPEDALGAGPKRGDYTGRVGPAGYQPHTSVRMPDGTVRLVPQRPRTEQIGDALGVKGGVETDPSHPMNRAAGSRVAPSTDETTSSSE